MFVYFTFLGKSVLIVALVAGLLTQFFPCCALAIRSFSKSECDPWITDVLFQCLCSAASSSSCCFGEGLGLFCCCFQSSLLRNVCWQKVIVMNQTVHLMKEDSQTFTVNINIIVMNIVVNECLHQCCMPINTFLQRSIDAMFTVLRRAAQHP